jgi:hypothetical protein
MDAIVGYQETVLTVEPHGIEPIPAAERHGHVRSLFTLWFAANMGLPVWLVGALAVLFGLGFRDGVIAILVGNLIGCGLLALTSTMAPSIGIPQLPFTRRSFGRRGVYLPALLNWVSTCGWYAVNSILGSLALARLTHLPFGIALALLSIAQVLAGIYGYNFIHQFEAVSAVVLAAVFVAMTAIGLPKAHLDLTSTLPTGKHLGLFILMATAVASYVFSWSPYAADYARYLPRPDIEARDLRSGLHRRLHRLCMAPGARGGGGDDRTDTGADRPRRAGDGRLLGPGPRRGRHRDDRGECVEYLHRCAVAADPGCADQALGVGARCRGHRDRLGRVRRTWVVEQIRELPAASLLLDRSLARDRAR